MHVCGVPWDPRKASHPDGKTMRKVQSEPILLPHAVQQDSVNQTSEHHVGESADQSTNENHVPETLEVDQDEREDQEMTIPSAASSSSTKHTSCPACAGQHRAHTRHPGCNLWRPEAEKRSISAADIAFSKRGRVQEALDRERLTGSRIQSGNRWRYSLRCNDHG